jgi:hypothetical protein
MEFTFHNSYGILELVPSTVMFLIKLNCWLKSHSNTATLLLGGSHCYKNCTVIITIWLTVTKYHISQMTMDLLLFTNMFSIYHSKVFYRTWLYTWVTRWASYEKQKLITLSDHLCSPLVSGGVCVAYLFSFLFA